MSRLVISRPGIVAPVAVDRTGRAGPTPGRARGPHWESAGPRHYVPAGIDRSRLDQRIVEAVGCLPPGVAATGWAALAWLGARWFDGTGPDGATPLPVAVALGDRRAVRPRSGVTLSEDWLFDGDVVVVDGLPITIPLRSVTYEARRARDLVAAVTVIDMSAYDDLVDRSALRAYAARLLGRPGSVQLADAVDLSNENAWSPAEVGMRRCWEVDRGVRLRCNQPVFDLGGTHLFTPDLLDLEAGVAGEYNGDVHAARRRRSRDLVRDDLGRRFGIEVATMMGGRGERQRFLERLDGSYARAAERTSPRNWTIEQPPGWVDTSTVARRRMLSDDDRARWLRYRGRT